MLTNARQASLNYFANYLQYRPNTQEELLVNPYTEQKKKN